MTPALITEVCSERMAKWAKRMASEHATPVLAIGVGHDHNSGQLTMHVTEDLPDEMLTEFVKFLYSQVVMKSEETETADLQTEGELSHLNAFYTVPHI